MTRDSERAAGGRFITLEGPDGAGKTSQAEALRSALAAAGIAVSLVREPGGTPAGERIRSILLERDAVLLGARADALLFNAARAQLVADVIRPALGRGETILSARFADSTIAYQGYGAGLPLDDLRALERFATGGLKPDLTILLDLPAELGLARKTGAELTRFEAVLDAPFHRRVRDGFLALAAAEPDRFVIVDGSAAAQVVSNEVVDAVADRLPELAPALRAVRPAMTGEPEAAPARINR